MPFAVPTVRGCRLQARQRVRTTGAEVTLEHVLATADGRGYGLIKNLQTCIYGRVRHGVELDVPAVGAAAAALGHAQHRMDARNLGVVRRHLRRPM